MMISEQLLPWLKLTPQRLDDTIELLKHLADCSDPLQKVIDTPYQLNPSQTYCQRMPLGVVALIYETFPELAILAAGFCLKTANSLILRGCGASSHSNQVITQLLQEILVDQGWPATAVQGCSLDDGSTIQDLVTLDQYINLIIPYGRPALLNQVMQLATAPVLKAAMGNCYLYWSASTDVDFVRGLILDSHTSTPDPVNAIEKVLISSNHNPTALVRLFNHLQEKGFELRGDESLREDFSEYLSPAGAGEWNKPYLSKKIAFKRVADLAAAIRWINHHSSGHADVIATESYRESRKFAMELDSALIYINSSPRFVRNPKQGESVFFGISNQKGQRRGLISLETFTTIKQVIQG
jgi:glutamate-5-semialdehyde dehydrogenase